MARTRRDLHLDSLRDRRPPVSISPRTGKVFEGVPHFTVTKAAVIAKAKSVAQFAPAWHVAPWCGMASRCRENTGVCGAIFVRCRQSSRHSPAVRLARQRDATHGLINHGCPMAYPTPHKPARSSVPASGTPSRRQIFQANPFGVSKWRGTASIAPFVGLIKSE
jgi:hypothetical protein